MADPERLEKLNALIKAGIEPYPYSFSKTHDAKDIVENFPKYENQKVSVAGRLMSIREHGKLAFGDLQDGSGRVQLWLGAEDLGKDFELLKYVEAGDIVGVHGTATKTKRGEISVKAEKFILLTKALRHLPSQWYGLKDTELRYRQRYVDLIMNEKVREIFLVRTKIINAIREFLNSKNFLEVETPILQPVYGGAAAKPFKTFMNDLKMDVYLRIADELYLKKLVAGGFERVYEFGKDFRNESIDVRHNPEFTQLEYYIAYYDFNHMMDLFEELMRHVCKKVLGTTKIEWQGHKLDLGKWERLTMADAIKKYLKLDVNVASDAELRKYCADKKIEADKNAARGELINAIFESFDKTIIMPTLIMAHPHETCPLAKQHRKFAGCVERFEAFAAGMELGNSYSELNDPQIQRKLLDDQVKGRKKDEAWAEQIDEDFLRALEYGMPPTGGQGIGIDRLVMLLTNQSSIKEVIFFPFMSREN